jgi:PAS domain S-box-containing protein
LEYELRRSSQFLETIIENANVWLNVLDNKNNVVTWNKAAEVISGYSREEVLGHDKIWSWLYPDDEYRKQVTDSVTRLLREGSAEQDVETNIRRKDGQTRTICWNERALVDEHRKVIGSVAIGLDVTERRRMEEYLQLQINRMPIGLIVWTRDFRVQSWNPAAEKIFGFTAGEAMGKHPYNLIVPREAQAQVDDIWRRLLEGDMTAHSVNENVTKAGRTIICQWSNTPLRMADGTTMGVLSMVQDITERKQVEEALANERNVLRQLIDNLPDIVYIKDVESRFVTTNLVHVHHLRAKALDEIVGKTDFDLYPRELAASYYEDERAVIRSGEPLLNREERTLDPEGKTRWLLTTKVPLRDDHGKVIGIVGIGRDITERKEMQEQLKQYSTHLEELVKERSGKLAESERRFRELANLLPQIVFETDVRGNYTFVNRSGITASGYTEEEVYSGLNAAQTFVEGDRVKIKESIGIILTGKSVHPHEFTALRKDGTTFPVLIHSAAIFHEGKPVGVRGVAMDITERVKMEKALRESESRFRELAELLPQVVFETDEKGIFTFVNHVGLVSTGYTENDLRRGVNLFQLVTPEEYGKVSGNLARPYEKKPISLEVKVLRKDNSVFPALVYVSSIWHESKVVGFRGIVVDITERKRMEEALLKSEKLAAIGETARMVAHDLRNPLQGIAGAVHLLKKESLTAEEKHEMLRLIQASVEYSDNIVRDLLEFSGEIQLKPAETITKTLTRDAIKAVEIPEKIVVQDLSEEEAAITVDQAKMKRVLINLLENAIDAMPQGGMLTISSKQSDHAVEIALSDTGPGMSQEVLENLWKPLQTTKAKGLGLGLAICKRIVDAHGGNIWVKSKAGEGTTVTVRLPTTPRTLEVKET